MFPRRLDIEGNPMYEGKMFAFDSWMLASLGREFEILCWKLQDLILDMYNIL